MIRIQTPLTKAKVKSLTAGDQVLISGTIYSLRDAGHAKLEQLILADAKLPFSIADSILYYCGPSPAKPGSVIGSAGPTTSYRMDDYTPLLLEKGLTGMIGKGQRDQKVVAAMIQHQAVYFGAVGGAGALLAQRIKQVRVIGFEELGTEALREMVVEDFPAIVVIDCQGNNLYHR